MNKRFLCILFALLMTAALLTLSVSAGNAIDKADVGIITPVGGCSPSYELSIPEGAEYYNSGDNESECIRNGIRWADLTDNVRLNPSEDNTFVTGKRYAVEIWLTPADGYEFVDLDDVTPTINGTEALMWSAQGNQLWMLFNFPVTELPHGTCGENLTWLLDEDGVLTVSGTGAMYDYNESSNLPPWYAYGENISGVIIEDGVTYLGYCFLYKTGAASVSLGKDVASVNGGTFYGCESIRSFTVAADSVNFCTVDGVLFNKDKTVLVTYPAAKAGTSYDVPASVKKSPTWLFSAAEILKRSPWAAVLRQSETMPLLTVKTCPLLLSAAG